MTRYPLRVVFPIISAICVVASAARVVAQANAAVPRTVVETSSAVLPEFDACLNDSVRELGMSAKRQGEDRKWRIGPQFLHPSIVPDGTLQVRFEKNPQKSTVLVTASWPGGLKATETQVEIEDRLRSMAGKLAQVCGSTRPAVACETTAAGGAKTPCQLPRG